MSSVITTRQMRQSDLTEVLELMKVSLGEPPGLGRTPALFRWKHYDNPFGQSIALVADSGDRIVGLRTFMRWELKAPDGRLLRAVRAVDTATHPEFQRRGIFRSLTEAALDLAREDGVDLVFNTPNEKSKPGYLKLGWSEVGPIGAMVRPSLRSVRPAAPGTEESVDIERLLDDSGSPVDRVDFELRPALGFRTNQTETYLRWRFSHPGVDYRAVAAGSSVAVVRGNRRRDREELVVADVFGTPRPALKRVIATSRADHIATWFSKGSPERRAAIRLGIVPLPGVRALTLVIRPLGSVPEELRSIDAWDTAVSDFELL